MVDDDTGGPLISRITGIRREVSKLLGFVIPPVRIKDDLALSANQYRIRIGQTIVGEDIIYPDSFLCIAGEEVSVKISGHEVKDPSFGVRPIPAFEMVNVPEAVPAVPTKSPVALVVCWKNVLPISYPESATVVPRPTLIFLEFNSIASGRRVGICLLPSVNSGL